MVCSSPNKANLEFVSLKYVTYAQPVLVDSLIHAAKKKTTKHKTKQNKTKQKTKNKKQKNKTKQNKKKKHFQIYLLKNW